ncbi:hypothetical protein BT69DRAFT_1297481 [Atractiella rhizophila]|nr:hypothetical protein BT69DRAFT_1297481 [Atractiella rhizophila]
MDTWAKREWHNSWLLNDFDGFAECKQGGNKKHKGNVNFPSRSALQAVREITCTTQATTVIDNVNVTNNNNIMGDDSVVEESGEPVSREVSPTTTQICQTVTPTGRHRIHSELPSKHAHVAVMQMDARIRMSWSTLRVVEKRAELSRFVRNCQIHPWDTGEKEKLTPGGLRDSAPQFGKDVHKVASLPKPHFLLLSKKWVDFPVICPWKDPPPFVRWSSEEPRYSLGWLLEGELYRSMSMEFLNRPDRNATSCLSGLHLTQIGARSPDCVSYCPFAFPANRRPSPLRLPSPICTYITT